MYLICTISDKTKIIKEPGASAVLLSVLSVSEINCSSIHTLLYLISQRQLLIDIALDSTQRFCFKTEPKKYDLK